MNRPWMPLYVADYLADTAHLRAAESGAYMHLIMHYWRNDGLPDDDVQLAAIARMTAAEWERARPLIEPLFKARGRWRHKRIELELARARRLEQSGRKGGFSKAKRKQDVAGTHNSTPPSTPVTVSVPSLRSEKTSEKKEVDARAREPNVSPLISPEAFALAEQFCAAIRAGPDDERRNGVAYTAQVWVARGYDRDSILALGANIANRKHDLPISYFAKAVERDQEERKQNPQKFSDGGPNGTSWNRGGGGYSSGARRKGGFASVAVQAACEDADQWAAGAQSAVR